MRNTTRLSRMSRSIKGQFLKRVYGMLTCREIEGFILAYLDGELTRKQLTTFKIHLLICRECREYVEAYQRAVDINKEVLRASDKTYLKDIPDDLIEAILKSK